MDNGQGRRLGFMGVTLALGIMGCGQAPTAPAETGPHRPEQGAQRKVQQVQIVSPGQIFQQMGGVTQQVGGGSSWPFGGGWPFGGSFSFPSGGGTSYSSIVTGPGSVSSSYSYSSAVSGNREEIRGAYYIGGPKALEVSNVNGNVVITRSPDDNLSITAIKESWAGPEELRKANIVVSDAGAFSIRSNYSDPGAKVGITYDIRIPDRMTIGRVTTGSGTVTINR